MRGSSTAANRSYNVGSEIQNRVTQRGDPSSERIDFYQEQNESPDGNWERVWGGYTEYNIESVAGVKPSCIESKSLGPSELHYIRKKPQNKQTCTAGRLALVN